MKIADSWIIINRLYTLGTHHTIFHNSPHKQKKKKNNRIQPYSWIMEKIWWGFIDYNNICVFTYTIQAIYPSRTTCHNIDICIGFDFPSDSSTWLCFLAFHTSLFIKAPAHSSTIFLSYYVHINYFRIHQNLLARMRGKTRIQFV